MALWCAAISSVSILSIVLTQTCFAGWGINVPDVQQTRVGSAHRYFSIDGLRPGRDYVVSLRAFNRMGNGFPIYETVRTISTVGDESSRSSSTNSGDEPLRTPVGLQAITDSATSVKVSWTDSDAVESQQTRVRDGRVYTIRYSSSSDSAGQQRYTNVTETEAIVDGLKPNTQYEFAVRTNVGRTSSAWSMSAYNRTWSSAPSSAPRDVTAVRSSNGDPLSVMLSWQPPKYSNGEIEGWCG
jgi:hypothetical protein